MSDTNQYGYGLDPVLQQVLFALSSRDQAGQSGRMQDIIAMLFDPKFAAFGGNFDPAYTQQQQFTPTYGPYLSSSLNSAVPIWRQAATSIINGDIDPTSAVLEVATALGVTEDTPNEQGLSFDAVEQQVLKMFDEAGAAMKEEQDFYKAQQAAYGETVFGKAGLPNPQAQYTLSEELATADPMRFVTLPYSQEYQDMVENYNKQMRTVEGLRSSANAVTNREMSALYEKMWQDYEREQQSKATTKEDKPTTGDIPAGQTGSPIPITSDQADAFAESIGVDRSDVSKAMQSAISDLVVQYGMPMDEIVSYERGRDQYESLFKQYLERETNLNIDTVKSFTPEAQSYFQMSPEDFRTTEEKRATEDQAARRGIAYSYKAQEKAKAVPAVSEADKRLRIEQGKAKSIQGGAEMQRMIDMYLANLSRRSPTSDALQSRLYSALGM